MQINLIDTTFMHYHQNLEAIAHNEHMSIALHQFFVVTEHECPSLTRFTHRTCELHLCQVSSAFAEENGKGVCCLQSVKLLTLLLDTASQLACLQSTHWRWTISVTESREQFTPRQ
jgi:hypothetical protein